MAAQSLQFQIAELENHENILKTQTIGNKCYVTLKWAVPQFKFNQPNKNYMQHFWINKDIGVLLKLSCLAERWYLHISGLDLKASSYSFDAYVLRNSCDGPMAFGSTIPFRPSSYSDKLWNYVKIVKDGCRYENETIFIISTINFTLLPNAICESRVVEKPIAAPLDYPEKPSEKSPEEEKPIDEPFDLEQLLDNRLLSDLTLKVGKEEFHVHKCILAGRSPRFFALFSNDCSMRSIEIVDVEPEVMRLLLRYVYTGKIDSTLTCANLVEVFVAANRYCVAGLLSRCQALLVRSLNAENAIDVLIFAEEQRSECLKNRAMEVVLENRGKYSQEQFKQLMLANPMLLVECMAGFSS